MIEVGEYVRINNDFRLIALGIGKVVRINKDSIHVKMNFELPFSFKKENIANHSKQLIDLIEEGYYVNGELITDKWDTRVSSIRSNFSEEDIQTILTKESYMANYYKVGGEDE